LKTTGPDREQRARREYREMTVALIRDNDEADSVEVAFSESARFYRLSRNNTKFDIILRLLREAGKKKRAVRVLVDSPEGEMIEDAEPAA
jgi:hypothetical protein